MAEYVPLEESIDVKYKSDEMKEEKDLNSMRSIRAEPGTDRDEIARIISGGDPIDT